MNGENKMKKYRVKLDFTIKSNNKENALIEFYDQLKHITITESDLKEIKSVRQGART